MFRHDFIMRILRRFINAMILLVKLRKEQRYHAARELIGQTWEELFGLPSETIYSLSERTLLAMLQVDRMDYSANIDTCLMVARLFKEDGDLAELQHNEEEARQRYLKALNLYLEIADNGAVAAEAFRWVDTDMLQETPEAEEEIGAVDPLDPQADIAYLIQKFDRYILPEATQQKLFTYYEKFGQYASAEDMLFEILEHRQPDPETVRQGILFYERLLKKSDDALLSGNLPRDEVVEGLKKVKGLRIED